MADPQKWSEEELKTARDIAERRFIIERQGEGPTAYYETWESVEPQVKEAISATGDLRAITGQALLNNRGLWQKLRYFTAPPISEEDLWTLVGKKFKHLPETHADAAAEAFKSVLDTRRFKWVLQDRSPEPDELVAAIMATTVLLSHETLKTNRRGASSRAQEDEVARALVEAGLTSDSSRTPIAALDELPRGHFSRERKVSGAKCDLPVRLQDGRLLALECKVSNGPKNSWKRLQREVGGKAESWRATYGRQVITGAVLAGVFDMRCLLNAQNQQNVALYWQHDLTSLIKFTTN